MMGLEELKVTIEHAFEFAGLKCPELRLREDDDEGYIEVEGTDFEVVFYPESQDPFILMEWHSIPGSTHLDPPASEREVRGECSTPIEVSKSLIFAMIGESIESGFYAMKGDDDE